MEIEEEIISSKAIKLFIKNDSGKEVGRAYLYLIYNGLHEEPYGFLEDVYVDESLRGQGIGTKLLDEVLKKAKENKCYKLIATSRYAREKVHKLYEKLGFRNYGIEFRMDFE